MAHQSLPGKAKSGRPLAAHYSMIKIEVDDKDVRALLEKVKRRAEDPAPLMRQIAGIMADEVEENFEKEGRPKWRPLRPSTIKARARKGHWPGKILQVSGKLAASITQKADATSAQVGTNRAYAAIQQFGGTINHSARERVLHFKQAVRGQVTFGRPGTGDKFAKKSKAHYAMKVQGKAYQQTIPARPFLVLTDGSLKKIRDKILDWLRGD